jgi:hypothetical protein
MNVTFNVPLTAGTFIVDESAAMAFNHPTTINLLHFTGGVISGYSDSIIIKVCLFFASFHHLILFPFRISQVVVQVMFVPRLIPTPLH